MSRGPPSMSRGPRLGTPDLNTAVTSISILLLLSILKEEFNLLEQFCFDFHGGLCSPYRFVIYNIEQNHGLGSMIFYDTKIIPECDSSLSLSLYLFRYPNLIRHHTTSNNAIGKVGRVRFGAADSAPPFRRWTIRRRTFRRQNFLF